MSLQVAYTTIKILIIVKSDILKVKKTHFYKSSETTKSLLITKTIFMHYYFIK